MSGTLGQLPEHDKAFLETIVSVVKNIYAATGSISPTAVLEPEYALGSGIDINAIAMPMLAGSSAEKTSAINIVRYYSVKHRAARAAILFETWHLELDDKRQHELDALARQGKGLGDHPEAQECVTIVIESDHGRTYATLSIDRQNSDMAGVQLSDDIVFQPADVADADTSDLTNFYIRTVDRARPHVIAWMTKFDGLLDKMEVPDDTFEDDDDDGSSSPPSTPRMH